jgi:hypothetical protein
MFPRDGRPEGQDIDPRIGPKRRGVARKRQRNGAGGGIPGLRPRHASAIEIGDDSVGDILIDVGAIALGHGSSLHDGGREAFSLLQSVAASPHRSHSRPPGREPRLPYSSAAVRARDRHRRPRRRRRLGERRSAANRAISGSRPDAPQYSALCRRHAQERHRRLRRRRVSRS